MKHRLRFVPLLLAVSCGMPAVWVEEEERRSFPSEGLARIECSSGNGKILVRAGPDATIEVAALKRAGGDDDAAARDALSRIVPCTEVRGDTLVLRWPESHAVRHASVAWTIHMPARLAAALQTSNGAIDVAGVAGELTCSTSNGRIRVADCGPRCEARTSNGSVSVHGALRHLDVHTSNGTVEAQVTEPGEVGGRIRTSNGAVQVQLADGVSTALRCATSNGRVTVAHAGHRVSDRAVELQIGAAERALDIQTTNGAIDVR